jgi:hypothetical protein
VASDRRDNFDESKIVAHQLDDRSFHYFFRTQMSGAAGGGAGQRDSVLAGTRPPMVTRVAADILTRANLPSPTQL